ncbi:DUF1698 domain-containing protein [Pseudoxanthomonas sp. JBR18]|uniref:class I SAM-dependent methyltransferase n=1 Tax=Pseudoxanthomonas sp. JBR18 TaxID=2969308 RepID=UPI002306C0F9|nr:DUF1698 domain-containing protein [Pseudoxanthomonas sp. JBR18]WCE03215.1 DUF1698 domain-containing protein [Pseudoxanthomonas sp. JBR18]
MPDAMQATLLDAFEKTRSGSKHACYQEIPAPLLPYLANTSLPTLRRYERARLDYVLQRIEVKDRSVLDIGCNSGFFLMEMLQAGARHATGYEGSKDHVQFLEAARAALGLEARLTVNGRYFDFTQDRGHHDIALLLNVLHHVGDDYGDPDLSVQGARAQIIHSLIGMRERCNTLVFQLGFNWKGDRHAGLFEHGTIEEMVAFITDGVRGVWKVRHVGVAEQAQEPDDIVYRDLCPANAHRKDALGEFLNRPLFVLA